MQCRTLAGIAAALALALGGTPARAQLGTAFTYQGQLGNSGAPVSGNVDLQFQLFTAATAGTTVGTLATNLNVPVSNGLFTTSVDVGVNPYTSFQPLFLQIAVRNPAGAGPYVNMTARQPITATPFSLATRGISVDSTGTITVGDNASNPGALNLGSSGHGLRRNFGGNPSNMGLYTTGRLQFSANGPNTYTMSINSTGNVGIGEDNPSQRLHVIGNVLSSTGGPECAFILQPANGFWIVGSNASGNGTSGNQFYIADNLGGGGVGLSVQRGTLNVGIGTQAPTQKLHVLGNILATGTITPSCAKLKENVEPMGDALDRIAGLNAVRFDWKADEAKVRGFTHDLGFIAEDVAKVFPEVVFRDDKGEVMGLDYARMSAVAVGAIKQLKAENDRMKADSAEFKARLEKIEALLAAHAAPAK